MQEYIVLGQIPGTELQLSFTAWLYLVAFLVLTVLLQAMWRRYALRRDIRHAESHANRIFHTMQLYRQH